MYRLRLFGPKSGTNDQHLIIERNEEKCLSTLSCFECDCRRVCVHVCASLVPSGPAGCISVLYTTDPLLLFPGLEWLEWLEWLACELWNMSHCLPSPSVCRFLSASKHSHYPAFTCAKPIPPLYRQTKFFCPENNIGTFQSVLQYMLSEMGLGLQCPG